MSEASTIERSPHPITRQQLASDLSALGVEPGMTLLVHSSLSALGWVPGGPVAVVQALMDALTPTGTLVMPAHTGDYSDPSEWQHPPVPEDWWPIIREHTPAFDPAVSPTRGIGKIAENFRTWPDVRRSYHPHVSFAAWGRDARQITANHSLDFSLGEGSPLARVYDLDGWVLLLGVGFASNTSFHLAEYRAPNPPLTTVGGPVSEYGARVWKVMDDVKLDEEPFAEIGAVYEEIGEVTVGKVGLAECRLFRQRRAVDFVVNWLTAKRVT
jgi:aminoglycoside 3-N-acetyltransferase